MKRFQKIIIVFMFLLVICSTFSSFADGGTSEADDNTLDTEETTPNDVDTSDDETEKTTKDDAKAEDKTPFSELKTIDEQKEVISNTENLEDLRGDPETLNEINSKSELKKTYLEKTGITVADESDLGSSKDGDTTNIGLTIDKDGTLKLGENGPTYTPKDTDDGAIISGDPTNGYTISFKNQNFESQDNNHEQDLTIKLPPANTGSQEEDNTNQNDLSNVKITQNDDGNIEIKSKSNGGEEQTGETLATISSNFNGEVNLNDDGSVSVSNEYGSKLTIESDLNFLVDSNGYCEISGGETNFDFFFKFF